MAKKAPGITSALDIEFLSAIDSIMPANLPLNQRIAIYVL
jgi:hypothetical protein